jgi:RNA polymerase sigma-70 factor (ECF subfamily)
VKTVSADRELLARYHRGDARAMDELVDRHGGAIYNFVRRFLGRDGRVDDVVQEVWLKVLRASAGFDGRSRFTTWLFTIARNACLDDLRKRKRLRNRQHEDGPHELADAADPGPPVHERVSRQELSALVDQAIQELPDDLREVFLLREQTDMTFTEIAEALSLPRETAKSRMRYAMLRVRKALRAQLGEEARPRGL